MLAKMWPFVTEQYHAVARDEEEAKAERYPATSNESRRRPFHVFLGAAGIILAAIILGGGVVYGAHSITGVSLDITLGAEQSFHDAQDHNKSSGACPTRREWRDLTPGEQQQYISAVLCLQNLSSVLAPTSNYTSYDDFPWLHAHVGYATHHSAPFLPWHRYFLHIYEDTLRTRCGYTGSLVYWDWTKDFHALEKSPVFDSETGFGGDGDADGQNTVGRTGRCVADGPFAHTEVPFYDVKYQPHCLSRGFRDFEGKLGHIDGQDVSPEAIEEVLSVEGYEEFVERMEGKVHDVIPFGIAGDFETFTAPYDPIFFLHHTQLDRLWWIWQQRQPESGLLSYGGHKERHSVEMASLTDDLHYRGLAPDVKVKDVMDIENEMLCYRY